MAARLQTRSTPPLANSSDALLRQFIGYRIKRLHLKVREDMVETIETFGLRIGTFSALAVLMESPGISQSQLAQVLKLTRSGVVVIVDELETAGVLERAPVTGDRRMYALQVTPAGQRLWEKVEPAVQAHEDALFSGLDTAEQQALRSLLDKAIGSATRHRRRKAN